MWVILQQQEGVSDHDGTLPITSLGTKDWFSEQNPKLASPRQRADHSYTLYFSSISFSWQEANDHSRTAVGCMDTAPVDDR